MNTKIYKLIRNVAVDTQHNFLYTAQYNSTQNTVSFKKLWNPHMQSTPTIPLGIYSHGRAVPSVGGRGAAEGAVAPARKTKF